MLLDRDDSHCAYAVACLQKRFYEIRHFSSDEEYVSDCAQILLEYTKSRTCSSDIHKLKLYK
jgi:hypothetical protein